MNLPASSSELEPRTAELFAAQQSILHRRTDRMFAVLMAVQWVGGVVAALLISPRAWDGLESRVHSHVWAAGFLGLVFCGLPIALAVARPGRASTRHVIAVGQALASALLIHLTGGRIETHFHIFGSLAFFAFYRDVRVVLTFTVVVAVDHLLRGTFWPQSIFGVEAAASWRWVEHAAWVVFEDIFLIVSCLQGRRDMREAAERQARLELSHRHVEERVVHPLVESARVLAASIDALTGATDGQREMLAKQASAVQETQVTAEEIKQTSKLAARQAEALLEATTKADGMLRQVEGSIEQGMAGLGAIREQVGEISSRIQALEGRTRQMELITQTVKNLADQSNMLAVNAAIEAARSGEGGKGFTVVAREIRSLANQSLQSTEQVRQMLQDTREAIQAAVDISQRGAERMERSMEAIRASGESLGALSGLVKGHSGAVRQISAAVGQQASGVGQIFTAVTELAAMMDATLERTEVTSREALALHQVTEQVNGVIQNYRG